MNVLFLTFWYPTENVPSFGIFIKEHAAAAATANNDVVMLAVNVCSSKSFYKLTAEVFTDENNIRTHKINIQSRFYKWIYINPVILYFICRKYFNKHIQPDFKPDVVHSNVINPAGVLGYWLSRSLKVKHVITEHWSRVDDYMASSFFSRAALKAYNKAHAVTVVSAFLKSRIKKYITDPDSISVVPNVVNGKYFYYKEKKKKDNTITFVAVSAWGTPKRPDLFLDTLNEMAVNAEFKIILHLVGEGPLVEEWKAKNPVTNFTIHYYGKSGKYLIAEKMHDSDFFLHASDLETFSIVVAEALATGTPVLASNTGALPELINSSNGRLCSNNSYTDWVTAINEIVKIYFDNQQISKEGSDKYSLTTVGKLFDDLYRD